jgi:hypothetical protein
MAATQEANPQSHDAYKETLALEREVRYELASHL